MGPPLPADPDLTRALAITGSGGSGAVTAGSILLAALGHAGYYGLLTRSAGPQIRGGESAAMVRYARRPVACMGDRFDLLVALDWNNIGRFVDEIPLDSASLILADPAAGPVPEALAQTGARVLEIPFQAQARSLPEGRVNMVALGALGAAAGLPLPALEAGLVQTLGGKGKGAALVDTSLACLRLGYGPCDEASPAVPPPGTGRSSLPAPASRDVSTSLCVSSLPAPASRDVSTSLCVWNISGNEAVGLGALRGGLGFVAAYPITPATEILEWLAPRLERLGGALLQAEDELASVNMIIGSSFGGVPSLTATSGPGLSLMMEGLGLAVASETPVVVVDVQRGGPSTGIPTKSEQSDLNIALYGLHGDAPHLVLAALDIRDCVFTLHWAMRLAERLQTVAICLSDQILGQSRALCDPPIPFTGDLRRVVARADDHGPETPYLRYAATPDGVSPMAIPGTPGCMYTADGLEHGPAGNPSSAALDHNAQLAKRANKLTGFDFGAHWGEVVPEAPTAGTGTFDCIVTWGSATGPCREAAERLIGTGRPTRVVALRLLAPLQREALRAAIAGAESVLVVEQNHGAQLFHYLHAERALPGDARSLACPGPLPLRPAAIADAVRQTKALEV
jgi:2-oxoglutarate ferredoxin oxidoreductase subunit alpha